MPRLSSLSSRVRDFTGGIGEFDIKARTVRALIRELDARYPGLGEYVEDAMAIAIDGEITQDAHSAAIGMNSEVVLVPKISGG